MSVKTSLIALVAVVLLIAGCQNNPGPVQPSVSDSSGPLAAAVFQIPDGATLQSATFMIYVHEANGETIYVHRVTSDWDEGTVTWNNFGGAFDPTVEASFVADAIGWRSADITSLVQSWIDGTYDNYGILLDQQDFNFPRASYYSREFGSSNPYLEICYEDGGIVICEQILAMADAYIWEVDGDGNHGFADLLYTGWLNENDLEKQSLLMFEKEVPPTTDGCSRTIGYWKNWSGFGPQPDMVTQYLPIWLGNDGADSSVAVTDAGIAFEVLSMEWDSPKNGIIKLYAQLLAAKLNFAAGADDTDVADTVSEADDFLAAYGWGSWYELSKDDQKMVVGWMETLDDYNNGVIGPGHCDDYDDDEEEEEDD